MVHREVRGVDQMDMVVAFQSILVMGILAFPSFYGNGVSYVLDTYHMARRNILVVVVAFPTDPVDCDILVVVACGNASCDAWDRMAFQMEEVVVAYGKVAGMALGMAFGRMVAVEAAYQRKVNGMALGSLEVAYDDAFFYRMVVVAALAWKSAYHP